MAVLEQVSFQSHLWPTIMAGSLSSLLVIIIYRIFFHPLSKYPGPKLAAATGAYRAYYEIWKGGQMINQLGELHRQYGPIVRVAPNELHFTDPEMYHEIYKNGSKLTKDPFLYGCFGEGEASFNYCDPNMARRRRDVLGPLFSRRGVISMQGIVSEKVDKLCQIMADQYGDRSKAVDVFSAYRCATMDTVMSFCFAECINLLDWTGFRHPLLVSAANAVSMFWIFKQVPIIKLMLKLPPWVVLLLNPGSSGFLQFREILAKQLDKFIADPAKLQDCPHPIIYHKLLNPNAKGASGEVPSRRSLFDEAQNLAFAGGDTVGNTLTVGTFHILNNPEVYQKLVDELLEYWPKLDEPLGYEEAEGLPYLTAVIKESLRLSHGAVTSLSRVVPASGAVLGTLSLPGGTVVSSASPFIHANEEKFPNNRSFIPERWLQPDSKKLEHWLVPFSRGPRQCLGINLAYCELYISFSRIFRRFEMELYDTTEADLEWRDHFAPSYGDKRVRVLAKCRSI